MQDLFFKVTTFLPNVIAAILVLIIGIIIAASLGKVVQKIIAFTRVDKLVDKLGVNKTFKAFGQIKVSGILGWLVKWFLIVVVLIAVADILKLPQINDFLAEVARFLPNVVIAVVIMLIGFVGGNFVYELIFRSVRAAKMHSPRFLANIAKWSMVIFALMASLIQLNIARSLVQTLFTGLIAMLAIAGGIAFGLGGKDKARDWLDEFEKKL